MENKKSPKNAIIAISLVIFCWAALIFALIKFSG